MGHPGFSVRIFLPTGEPEGLRIVEKSNWTGQGLVFPRAALADVKGVQDFARAGVYILWGPSDAGTFQRVYVGEGDGVLQRLESHAQKKDFWTHAAVFVSKDQSLNKAHVQYLEARLVKLAAEARRCELDNGNQPQPPSLSPADVADVEGFLDNMLLCLPVVGVDFFEKPRAAAGVRTLYLRSKGIEAQGYESAAGFVVREGAGVVKSEVPSIQAFLSDLRRTLVQQGVLVDAGETWRLAQDYTFGSPSSAAGVLLGRSANGRTEWRDASDRTLKELQERGSAG